MLSLQIGETEVPVKRFQASVGLGGIILLLLLAGNVVMTLVLVCAALVAVHASFHKGVSYDVIAQRNGARPADLGV